jgi:hypothetical protein
MSATTDIRRALAAAVAEIAPDAVVLSAGQRYEEPKRQFSLRIVAGPPTASAAIERLDAMLDDDGDLSVKAALEQFAMTDRVINSLWVARNSGHRLFPGPSPAEPLLGAEWLVDVL